MKATEKDVIEWLNLVGKSRISKQYLDIDEAADFHNWMEGRQEKEFLEYIKQDADKPKPEPKMEKPECYELFNNWTNYALEDRIKYWEDKVLEYPKYIEACKYILAERTSKIEVGCKYRGNHDVGHVIEILGIYKDQIWIKLERTGQTDVRPLDIIYNYTKLLRDEH